MNYKSLEAWPHFSSWMGCGYREATKSIFSLFMGVMFEDKLVGSHDGRGGCWVHFLFCSPAEQTQCVQCSRVLNKSLVNIFLYPAWSFPPVHAEETISETASQHKSTESSSPLHKITWISCRILHSEMRMKRSWALLMGRGGAQSHSEPSLLSTPISPHCLIFKGLEALPVGCGESWGWCSLGVRSGRILTVQMGRGGSDVILDGENQTRAAAQQLLFTGVQLAFQRLLRGAAASFAVCTPARPPRCIPPATGRPVGSDGSVTEHEGQVAVIPDEVRVVVPQLLMVLKAHPQGNVRGGMENVGGWTHTHTHTDAGDTAWAHVVWTGERTDI